MMYQFATMFLLVLASMSWAQQNPPIDPNNHSPEEPPGIGLRKMVLSLPASELGFTPDAEYPHVYGVAMDWNVGDETVTVMSMRDGSASLYSTFELGILGGIAFPEVRRASRNFVRVAENYVRSSEPVTVYPYPGHGELYYYLLTYDGVRRVSAEEPGFFDQSSPTLPLFQAAQDVLTALRQHAE